MGPIGAAARDERSQLVRKLCEERQKVPTQPRAKARPALEPSPFSSWEGPWSQTEYKTWKGLTRSQKRAWEAKRREAKKGAMDESKKPSESEKIIQVDEPSPPNVPCGADGDGMRGNSGIHGGVPPLQTQRRRRPQRRHLWSRWSPCGQRRGAGRRRCSAPHRQHHGPAPAESKAPTLQNAKGGVTPAEAEALQKAKSQHAAMKAVITILLN